MISMQYASACHYEAYWMSLNKNFHMCVTSKRKQSVTVLLKALGMAEAELDLVQARVARAQAPEADPTVEAGEPAGAAPVAAETAEPTGEEPVRRLKYEDEEATAIRSYRLVDLIKLRPGPLFCSE